ncbi:MAG TPA: ABC transporter permease [Gemmatimonadaceae bacterium]|jgi:ABC-2 type transport system permease protein|nr:ABC transporter permease [Gemmatimonadaceae bacterium]
MHKIFALVRASWLVGASYRMAIITSFGSLIVTVVPVFYIARALQPMMGKVVQGQGGDFFGFVLVGMVAFMFIGIAVGTLPGIISGSVSSGTLEAYLTTPSSLPTVLAGLMSYDFLWSFARAVVLVITGAILGAHIAWGKSLLAIGILALIVLSYLPFGILGASLMLWFRTTGPLPKAVIGLSGFLGGVYYPTHVIPSWLHSVSSAIPLTYGLRALRRVMLEGKPLSAVAPDLGILMLFIVGLCALSVLAFSRALHDAKRTGSLAQY